MKSKLEQTTKLITINLLVVGALFVLSEYASRVFHRVDFPDPVITEMTGKDSDVEWPNTREYDPLLFWRMKPNIERAGRMLTNSIGLRGPEIPEKSGDEFLILSLGESTTFGVQLPYADTYTARLQSIGTINGKTVRCINAGVPAYSIVQGAAYLKHHGLNFDPDLVLIYFGYNDFLPVAYREARDAGAGSAAAGKTDLELLSMRDTLIYRFHYFLTRHSNLARSLAFRKTFTGDDIITDEDNPRVPEHDRELMLREISDLCRQHGTELIVVIPWYKRFRQHIHLLSDFTSTNDVHVIDLPRRLRRLGKRRNKFFRDNVHPNARGHRRIAREIAREIRTIWPNRTMERNPPSVTCPF